MASPNPPFPTAANMLADNSQHIRSGSGESHDSYTSSYNQMIGRVFESVGNREISLRTLYAANSAAYHRPSPQAGRAGGPNHSPMSSIDGQLTIQGYTQSLFNQLTNIPRSSASLPPTFINTFVRRCFPVELERVDFDQALTALDYLKDLEDRRNREVVMVLQRLGIQRNGTDSTDFSNICEHYPHVASFVQKLQMFDSKAAQLYSQLWIALRRWILINEFCTTPFNRQNCSAMLNTLYIPSPSRQPTASLTPGLIQGQRDGFLKLMDKVAKKGPAAVNSLKQQNARPGDATGWPAVHELVDLYLRSAVLIIDECTRAANDESLDGSVLLKKKARSKQVDSGVSFGPEKRASAGSAQSSAHSMAQSSHAAESIRPSRPETPASEAYQPKGGKGGLSGFSKFMKRSLTPSRRKIDDSTAPELPDERPASSASSLRKMRSLGNLSRRNGSHINVSNTRDDAPAFDREEMQRQRALYDARQKQQSAQSFRSDHHQWV